MAEYETPFSETIRRFHEAGVRFVLIGGVAMVLHGSSYLTLDTDFAYAIESENLERLAALLATIHARVLAQPQDAELTFTPELLRRVRFLNLKTDLGEVDLLRDIAGIDSFEGLWKRAVPMDLDGIIIRVASLDDLIAMKRAANRPKDQAHLAELYRLKALISGEEKTG